MPLYRIEISSHAQRTLRKLPQNIRTRIVATIDSLAKNPRPEGIEPVKGLPGLLRKRIGDYRIIYRIEDESLKVVVIRLGNRKEIYKLLKDL